MYTRSLTHPNLSFFLFGPRGTGKTTWLRNHFPSALWFNLLLDEDLLPVLGNSRLFRERVLAQPTGTWIVVDEVQRAPALLNEVHDILTRFKGRYRFALSGSSARKLRRLDVNLLAGRAVERLFFPLTAGELGADFDLEKILKFGTLPDVYSDEPNRIDILRSYVGTYLREEIKQEALVKDIGSFSRFLKIAALCHGQTLNVAGLSRDAGIARPTVQRYFETLIDTLVGYLLPAWKPRAKVREYGSPKFYFFDSGVVRTLLDQVDEPLSRTDSGTLLEGYILHELRAAISFQGIGGELSYWSVPGSKEVDFVYSKGRKHVGIEVKNSESWKPEYGKTLNELISSKHLARGLVVYRGRDELRSGAVDVMPMELFLKQLAEGILLRV